MPPTKVCCVNTAYIYVHYLILHNSKTPKSDVLEGQANIWEVLAIYSVPPSVNTRARARATFVSSANRSASSSKSVASTTPPPASIVMILEKKHYFYVDLKPLNQ